MLNLESIQEISDPYQTFLNSLRNKDVKRKYPRALDRFICQIPHKIFSDNKMNFPKKDSPSMRAKAFADLARKNPTIVKNIIATFIKQETEKATKGLQSPNTVPRHVQPIRAFLDEADIALPWKSLRKMLPRQRITEDRAYTREELQQMLAIATNLTDKVIVTMFASAGFRVEAWDYFTWKDVIFFKNEDGSFKGAALIVYRGDPEMYETYITPEACSYLSLYREHWKAKTGIYPKPDDPLLRTVSHPITRKLNAAGIKRRVDKIVKRIGLRPPLEPGKKRHPVPLDHGFRKSFNTNMRRAKVDYLDKEDMMGHKVGLEKHYERYNEEDFERFVEYQKAIPFLTISDTERAKLENQKLREEKLEIEKRIPDLVKQAADRIKHELLSQGWQNPNDESR